MTTCVEPGPDGRPLRYALSVTAHRPVTGPAVVATFQAAITTHGIPLSTLADNGMVFTTRFARGGRSSRNGLENELVRPSARRTRDPPHHLRESRTIPATMKRWLRTQPAAAPWAPSLPSMDRVVELMEGEPSAIGSHSKGRIPTGRRVSTPFGPMEGSWMTSYDVVVIGGGAGGLVAAKEARRRHASVVIVQDGPLGGDCTFTGCVPSKALLAAAAQRNSFDEAMTRVPRRRRPHRSHRGRRRAGPRGHRCHRRLRPLPQPDLDRRRWHHSTIETLHRRHRGTTADPCDPGSARERSVDQRNALPTRRAAHLAGNPRRWTDRLRDGPGIRTARQPGHA